MLSWSQESEVVDEPDSESEVKNSFIRTHVDFPAKPTVKLSLSAMRVSLSLRSPDIYNLGDRFTGGRVSYGAQYNRSSLQHG